MIAKDELTDRPPRPDTRGPVSADLLPKSVVELDQWICWEAVFRAPRWTKIPMQVDGRHRASSTDSATWSSFDVAFAASSRNANLGLGFVFARDGGIAGVDLDNCLDGQGLPKPWAVPIIERFADSYMEISPSGTGVKIFCRGNLEGLVANTGLRHEYADGVVELYQYGRFFTVTGKCFRGAPLQIEEHRRDLEWLACLTSSKPLSQGCAAPQQTTSKITGAPWAKIDIVVNHHPELPPALLDFIEQDRALSRLWNLRRPDLVNPLTGGPNFSRYDQGLASHFAGAGVPHQRIADILTAFRLKHTDPSKGHRLDYLQRTIYRAETGQRSANR